MVVGFAACQAVPVLDSDDEQSQAGVRLMGSGWMCATRLSAKPRPLLKQVGGIQGAPGAVTMEVAGDSQSGWGQLLAVGGAVAGGWGASKGMRQGVV